MSLRPRLLLLAPTVGESIGGTETVVARLAEQFAEWATLTLVTGESGGGLHGPAIHAPLTLHRVPFAGRQTPQNRWQVRWLMQNPFRVESRSFFRSLDRLELDLRHFDAVLTFYEHDAWLLAARLGADGPPALHLLPGVGHRRFFRRVKAADVLFVGHRGAARSRRKWGITCESLPLGVDTPFFVPEAPERPPSRRLVFVGRLDGSKRVDWLADAFVQWGLAAQGYTLEIIGDGPLGESLRRRHQHTRSLLLLGRKPPAEVAARLRGARLLLHPTELESFGLTLLEAMASGVPVITHDLPPIRAWASDHPVYADRLDAAAWRAAITAFEDEERWHAAAVRGLALAQQFSWAAIAAPIRAKLEARIQTTRRT